MSRLDGVGTGAKVGKQEFEAQVAELRLFSGMLVTEIAEVLEVSERTVKHDWQVARAWLSRELGASRHLHAVLLWAHQIMLSHAARLRDAPSLYEVPLRALHKGARLRYDELSRLCNSNLFSLDFVISYILGGR